MHVDSNFYRFCVGMRVVYVSFCINKSFELCLNFKAGRTTYGTGWLISARNTYFNAFVILVPYLYSFFQ